MWWAWTGYRHSKTVNHSHISKPLSANAFGGTQLHLQVGRRLLFLTQPGLNPREVSHTIRPRMIHSKTTTSRRVSLRATTCINSANVPGCRITRQIQYMARSNFIISLIPLYKVRLGQYRVHVKIQNPSSPRDIYFRMARYPQNLASVVVFCTETLASEDGE